MTDIATCPVPHPARGAEWTSLHPDLERMGGLSDDDWARCRKCGTWMWLTTETSKYMYADAWVLDGDLAERALIQREPDAIVDLLAGAGLPHGPMWSSPHAVITLLHYLAGEDANAALLPRIDDYADGTRAVGRPEHAERWRRVRDALIASERAAHATHRPLRVAAPLPFAVDVEADFDGVEEALELPDGALMLNEDRPVVLRLTASQLVQIPLAATPNYATRSDAGVVVTVSAGGQHAVVLFRAGGQDTAQVPAPVTVRALDDGHWLLWPEHGAGERPAVVCDPNLTPIAESHLAYPNPPRRWGGGWIASAKTGLAVLDRGFGVVATSNPTEPAALHVVDDARVLAHTSGGSSSLALWRIAAGRIERAWEVPCWSYARAGEHIALLTRDGAAVGLAVDGTELWRRPHGGASTVQRAGETLYLARAEGVDLLDPRSGKTTTTIPTGHIGRLDRAGTAYFAAEDAVWTLRGGVLTRHALGTTVAVVTTLGDAAVIHEPATDDYAVLGHDGVLRGWFATDHPLPIGGTHAGPYVLEPDRLRIGALPG